MIALLTAINIITATNMQRTVNNLPPLVENSRLDVAANRKAVDMASKQVFSHYYGKTTPWQFIEAEHYCYQTAGENLAVLFTDPSKVVEANLYLGTRFEGCNLSPLTDSKPMCIMELSEQINKTTSHKYFPFLPARLDGIFCL